MRYVHKRDYGKKWNDGSSKAILKSNTADLNCQNKQTAAEILSDFVELFAIRSHGSSQKRQRVLDCYTHVQNEPQKRT